MTYSKEQLEQDVNKIDLLTKAIRDKKGHDYACERDVLENVRLCGEYGVIIRCFDKLMRLKNISQKGRQEVNDETVRDTWLDLINYAKYGYILHQSENETIPIKRSDATFGGINQV